MSGTLDKLPIGQSARVTALDFTGQQRRRMLDLGFAAGSGVTALQRSPFGDPTAYGVLDTVIALRACDAQRIHIAAC
ncbi:MAG: ferrous iron transport protein A [Clostridiales bacterium]|nr:ferrous iron transport protein A [Clostridiales bacterium]